MYCHFHRKSGKSECPLLKCDLRPNERRPSMSFFLLLAVFYGGCSSQLEKTPQTDPEHGQTGQKLK